MTNGEKYKTVQERADAFNAFCDSQGDCARCKACTTNQTRVNKFCHWTWLDLEAEEEEPLPCPFCGSNMIYVHGDFGGRYHVHCGSCGYASRLFEEKYAAVAAHNRVAKKCSEEPK